MKYFLLISLAIGVLLTGTAEAGVSVSVGEPGFYGRVEIGNSPEPQIIYPQPVIVHPAPVEVVSPQPIYLHVPPGHAKRWKKYCHQYQACGQPVYFVDDRWYNDVYVPYYYEHEHKHKHCKKHHKKHCHHGHGKHHD